MLAQGRATRDLGIILALVLASTLPFAGKAFHIDDVYFIEVAGNILQDPLRPLRGAVALEDIDYRVFAGMGRCPSTFVSMSHPPLVPYVIAGAARLARGFSERWLHLAFIPFALGAAVASYSLARRFTRHPLGTTLLIISSPIFVLGAQSLMTDMPALALSVGALALLVQGVDRQRRGPVLAAGVLAGLAVVTRYSALLLVPVLLAYGMARGRLRLALPVLIGVGGVVSVWAIQNVVTEGDLHILASARHYRLFFGDQAFEARGLLNRTLGDLSGLGGTTFAAGLLLVLGSWRRALVFAGAALAAAAVFVLRPAGIERLDTYSPSEVAAVACCFGLGAVLLAGALRPGWDSEPWPREGRTWSDHTFLVAWLVVALAGALLLLPFGTSRYLLTVLPPLWLLLARRAESMWGEGRRLEQAFALVFAQGLCLSLILAVADDELAARYRAVARSVRESHPLQTIWFVGEWGFRYYMGTVGGRYLQSTDDSPQPGDIIIRPYVAGMHEISPSVRARSVRIQDIPLQGRWPIRLMSFEAKAGYYSHHWGYLPWSVSRAPLERIEIFEVRGPAPAVEKVTCASS